MVLGASLGGRARDDLDVGPRALAHDRVRRLRLLRRDPGGDLGHPAHRPEHRAADPHRRRATSSSSRTMSHGDTRHPILLPSSVARLLRVRRCRRSTSPSGCRRRCSCCRDLDLGMNNWMSDPFPYPEKPWDRGKVLDRRASSRELREVRALPRRRRRRHSVPHAARARRIRRAPTSRAARATTRRRATPRSPRPTGACMDRLAKKFETARDAGAAAGDRRGRTGAEVGLIAFGSTHWAMVEARDQLRADGRRDRLPAAQGAAVHRRGARASSSATSASTWSSRTATARWPALLRLEMPELRGAHPLGAPLRRPADRRALVTDAILSRSASSAPAARPEAAAAMSADHRDARGAARHATASG